MNGGGISPRITEGTEGLLLDPSQTTSKHKIYYKMPQIAAEAENLICM